MVIVNCSVPECPFQSDDVSEALAIALLTNHGHAHTAVPTGPLPGRGPRLERPQVNVGISTEEWNVFIRRWEVFRTGSGIADDSAPSQLFQCAETELGDSILKANPTATSNTLADLMATMKSLAVIPIATGVLRSELLHMRQEREESFRAYAARVRGKAETCAFSTKCECGLDVDYTDNSIRDTLLNGINDSDIRREILGALNILQMPVNDVIALVENKEMARNALPSSTMSSVSSFMRQKSSAPASSNTESQTADRSKKSNCPVCKKQFNLFSEGHRGWNNKPHQQCLTCFREHRRQKRPQGRTSPSSFASTVHAVESNTASHIASNSVRLPAEWKRQNTGNKVSLPIIDHHIFSDGEWKKARLRDHPRVPITITVAASSKNRTDVPKYCATVSAVADTGAQSDLWALSDFLASGFSQSILSPVRLDLSAANNSEITIEGAFFAHIEISLDKGISSCNSMIYVSSSVRTMYLSHDTLHNLGILPNEFPYPNPGRENYLHDYPVNCVRASTNEIRALNDGCSTSKVDGTSLCSCPQRSPVPEHPTTLPFPCSPENNNRMKEWLLNRYKSSTFNTCPHRSLPTMSGPPVEIHIDNDATPKACHTAANIPIHWQQRVHDDLLRDEALGVIERVPYGEPVNWCHRMVVTRKHNGSPRRTVDLSPLNKFCSRETFASESPFHLARRIPKGTWKTVTDAWNGYHSVPLRESDRHLTTFITPFGRWRYTRAPQGFVSSGDGYNRRFDAIISHFERKERCVDDTIHYDIDLAEHWWRTIDFLTLVGQAGIVLNPDKFQFAEQIVDFAGFRISDSTIEPLPKYLDAIRDFPTPKSTTDIRSWFGLVNQVTNYAQLRDTMAPFKPFLSPRHKFMWNAQLDAAFEDSKICIMEAIRNGVEIFDMKKRTCLRPDWSKKGIGYFLLQQCCNCSPGIPGCCSKGWRVTLAGSRFLSSAEERYAAVEGEALAVAWGLEQSRYFTQGCDNLIVVTDHKPLVKILGDRTLDEITNTRLFRLKQRTLPWRFEIVHLPGKTNFAADAASRYPSPSGSIDSISLINPADGIESAIMASICQETKDTFTIPWSLIANETASDTSLRPLLQLIERGFPDHDKEDLTIAPFWNIRHSLYVQEGVILYQDRVIIPLTLRHRVLQHLHGAHQGISSMEQRARAIVYWPGMSVDIRKIREQCMKCCRNAPSQAATPPIPSDPASTPFESVFADFFDYGGRHYLVVGDRLSGWVDVFASKSGTNAAGANGLVNNLRSFFATFGVPEELSSDGGPEFSACVTKNFLQRWGVRHRISSAYFPQSNGRAEVAVKLAKRLLMSNTGPTGSLDNDNFLRGMLQLRNTPAPDCNISPAQIIFGRPLRDAFSFVNRLEKFSNPNIRPLWRQAWAAKEEALRARMTRTIESLQTKSRPLRPLSIGERVFIQNQAGPYANKWDKSGTVVETLKYDQYHVKVDGSGRITLRNRRFLRAFTVNTTPVDSQTPGTVQPHHLIDHDQLPRAYQRPPSPNPQIRTMNQSRSIDQQTSHREEQAYLEPSSITEPDITSEDLQPIGIDAPPHSPVNTSPRRSRRTIRPPKSFEPETGKWVKPQ